MDFSHLRNLVLRLYGGQARPEETAALQAEMFQLQKPQAAWEIPSVFLAESDSHLRFFGALTLAIKLSRDFDTVDSSQYSSLKGSVLSWLSASANVAYPAAQSGVAPQPGERIVLRKLAVALTTLSIKLHATKSWQNWPLETITVLSATPGYSKEGVYEVLVIVVEEGIRADLTGKENVSYSRTLYEAAALVAQSLADTLQNPSSTREALSAINCCEKWGYAQQFSPEAINTLYPLLLSLITHPELSGRVCKCLDEWLASVPSEKYADQLLDYFASDHMTSLLQTAYNEQNTEEPVLSHIKLLITLFENTTKQIATSLSSSRSIAVVRNLLSVTSFNGQFPVDEEVSELSLTSWGLLQEELAEEGLLGESEIGNTARQIYAALVEALLGKITWPNEQGLKGWPKDYNERFATYRTHVGDALLNAYYVLRDQMAEMLVNRAFQQLSALGSETSYETFEATLEATRFIAEGVPLYSPQHISRILSADFLNALPTSLPQAARIRKTTLALITDLSEWISHNNPALLPSLNYVVSALTIPGLSQSAARAIRNLCEHCRSELVEYIPSFAGLIRELEGKIPTDNYVKVLGSVAAVFQALPLERALDPMLQLAEPLVSALAQSLASPAADPLEVQQRCIYQLECLTATAQGFVRPDRELLELDVEPDPTIIEASTRIDHDQRVMAFRNSMMESLRQVARLHGRDAEIAQVFRDRIQTDIGLFCLSQALSGVIKATSASTIPTVLSLDPSMLLEIVAEQLQQEPSSLWLTAAAVLPGRITRLDLSDEDKGRYIYAISMCCSTSLQSLKGIYDLESNPDIVQSLMSFCYEVSRFSMSILSLSPELVSALMSFSTLALSVQERVSLQRSIQLLTTFVHEAASEHTYAALFRDVVLEKGQAALQAILAGIGGLLPRSSLSSIAELLHAFVQRFPNQTRLWLAEMFAMPNFPSEKTTNDEKERFLKLCMSCRTIKRMRTAVEDFSSHARGLQGTAYGNVR